MTPKGNPLPRLKVNYSADTYGSPPETLVPWLLAPDWRRLIEAPLGHVIEKIRNSVE